MNNIKKKVDECIKWINSFIKDSGGINAVVGISGGKDSSVVAALCVEALGGFHTIGVMMPNGIQRDIDDSVAICHHLGLDHYMINIEDSYNGLVNEVLAAITYKELTNQARTNLPARLRMVTLYTVAQCMDGRVANTCNLSEDYIGYSTKYGDAAGDFAPISRFTSEEVVEIGKYLGLPDRFVDKVPSDGLCGLSDEENLGFSYKVLNEYINTGICEDAEVKSKIDRLHNQNIFKLKPIEFFDPKIQRTKDILEEN